MTPEFAASFIDGLGNTERFGVQEAARVLRGAYAEAMARLDRRQAELLAANTAEVERRRKAEWQADFNAAEADLWRARAYHLSEERKALALELDRLHDNMRRDGVA